MVAGLILAVVVAAGADDKVLQAEGLFQRARALLKADQPADACPLLAKSHALDPALGTLMNLADCEERIGKLVAAYLHFNDAAAWAERTHETARAGVAKDRASALKPKLSWLALSTRSPVRGLTVKASGFSVELGATPLSVPVDSGDVVVTATADTFLPWKTRVRVGAAATVSLEVPALKPEDPEKLKEPELSAAAEVPLVPAEPVPEPLPAVQVKQSGRSASIRPAPLAVIAGGAVAMIAGVAGLAWSWSTYGAMQRQQPGGTDAANPTVTRGTFSTLQWAYPLSWIAAVVGAVAVAGGATWYVLPNGVGGVF